MRASLIIAATGILAQTASASVFHKLRMSVGRLLPDVLTPRTGSGCSEEGSYNEECDCCGCTCVTEEYLYEMCYPDDTVDYDTGLYVDVTAPCELFYNQYYECYPNGTAEIDYIAEQECMCGGGFFQYFYGCMECEAVHGAYIGQDYYDAGYDYLPSSAISDISASFCTGTPTADFDSYLYDMYSTIYDEASTATSTAGTDLYPNATDVSLYFTATGNTGLGAITGSATAATLSYNTNFGDGGSDTVTDGLAPGQTGGSGTASTSTSTSLPPILTGAATTASTTGTGTTTSSSSTSTSSGAAAQMKIAGGLLAAGVVGVGLVL